MEPTASTNAFDIKPSVQPSALHHSRKIVLVACTVMVILAVVLIGLRIKAKRAYDAYLKTPDGQLQALRAVSAPVTATPQEQAAALSVLQTASKPIKGSPSDRIQALQALEQQ